MTHKQIAEIARQHMMYYAGLPVPERGHYPSAEATLAGITRILDAAVAAQRMPTRENLREASLESRRIVNYYWESSNHLASAARLLARSASLFGVGGAAERNGWAQIDIEEALKALKKAAYDYTWHTQCPPPGGFDDELPAKCRAAADLVAALGRR